MAPTSSFQLVMNPATGGAPIILSEAMPKAPKVKGMVRLTYNMTTGKGATK